MTDIQSTHTQLLGYWANEIYQYCTTEDCSGLDSGNQESVVIAEPGPRGVSTRSTVMVVGVACVALVAAIAIAVAIFKRRQHSTSEQDNVEVEMSLSTNNSVQESRSTSI